MNKSELSFIIRILRILLRLLEGMLLRKTEVK